MRAILLTGIVLVACTSPKTGNLLPGGPGDAGGGPSRAPGGPGLEADAGAELDAAQLVEAGLYVSLDAVQQDKHVQTEPAVDAGLPPIPDAGLARDTLDPVAMDRCQLYVETLCGWETGCGQGANQAERMNLCRERFRLQLDRCNRVGSTDGWQKCEHQLLNPPGDCTVLVRDGRVVVPADCAGVLFTRP
jgi:hypothetical protein